MHAMEKPAAARIRRSEKLPPSGMLSARRRRSSQSPAWPAFPTDSNARAGLGMGCGKQSPVASPARNGDGGSPASSSGSFSRKSVGKSSVRKKSSCCDSCRPHKGTKIEYDDVFGGPPKYFASLSKMSAPDYDDIFRRSFSLSPQSGTVRSKSKTEEIPVFNPQEYESGDVFEKPTSPAVKIGYEDVFGGPLAGPRTKMLKDLLRCSGFSKAGSRGSTQASSPVSSMHSVCRESHGNPVYEYESEGLGNGKHFNSPRKSSVGGKSPQAYVEVESKRKPAVTSVSASSSPFTEQFDNSTVHSYSTSFTDKVLKVNTGKACKVSSDEKVSKGDTEGVHENSVKNAFGDDNESSSSEFEMRYVRRSSPKPRKPRSKGRPSRVRSRLHSPIDTQSLEHNANVGKKEVLQKAYRRVEEPNSSDSDSSPIKESMEVSSTKSGKTDGTSKKESKQVSFITVSHVQLTTEPNASPPARPAPVKGFEVLSEREMSELLEAEAFMEYSIKDLDGLVAEEYVVSHESVSGSSVSTSLKTSPSGRSYEDEDSDHCYAKDAVEGVGDSSEVEKAGTKGEDVSGGDGEDRSGNDKDFTTPEKSAGLDVSKSNLEEILTSSSEHREGISVHASDELSSLCEFEEIEGETSERRKARWERHQRALERVAKALAEKNSRELEHERAQEEKQRVAELLDDVIKRWAAGKQGNLRALLSTLQYILWPECGWKHVSLIDIVEPVCVRKAYRKATLCVHPDKLQQKNASTEHKYIAEKVFDLLQEAWTLFNYEQVF